MATVDSSDDPVGPADGLLLDQFVHEHNQHAFELLVRRHGPYVLRVCQRMTSHAQDAEDVFQACFLELVRKASSIRQRHSVAGWLQTVAVRLSRKVRARHVRRRQKDLAAARQEVTVGPDDVSWREACRFLEEELAQLPEELRLPIILCLFRDQTQEEASRALDVNPRTLKDRLRRGREMLRGRLVRRGISLAVLGTLLSAESVHAAVPVPLHQATLQGGVALSNHAPIAGIVSPAVLNLAGGASSFAAWASVSAAIVTIVLAGGSAYVAWDAIAPPPTPQAPLVIPAHDPVTDLKKPSVQQEVHRSFRGKQLDLEFFQWAGTTPQRYIRREEEGLRISIPANMKPVDPVGLKLRYPVRGDFDLEATLEIVSIAEPVLAPSGVTVYLLLDAPDQEGIWIGKMKAPAEDAYFSIGLRTRPGIDRKTRYLKTWPASKQEGFARLRVVRRGTLFSYFASDGEKGEFTHLESRDLGAGNLLIVRFAADPGFLLPTTAVDVRLTDFFMRADAFVGYAP